MARPNRRGALGGGYPKVAMVGVQRMTPSQAVSHAIDFSTSTSADAEAHRLLDPETEFAILEAQAGDDSILLPYQPTPTSNPPRPRTLAAGYDKKTKTLRIRFRDGVGYEYYDVPPRLWNNLKRVKSPGRFINRYFTSGAYPYSRADW